MHTDAMSEPSLLKIEVPQWDCAKLHFADFFGNCFQDDAKKPPRNPHTPKIMALRKISKRCFEDFVLLFTGSLDLLFFGAAL